MTDSLLLSSRQRVPARRECLSFADLAQLVDRQSSKLKVASSILAVRSMSTFLAIVVSGLWVLAAYYFILAVRADLE